MSITLIKILPHPLVGSKVKYLNFTITQSVVNILFTEISHADRNTINKKHLNVIFYRRPVPDALGGLRVGVKTLKFIVFQNMVMLHIKLKGIWNSATW